MGQTDATSARICLTKYDVDPASLTTQLQQSSKTSVAKIIQDFRVESTLLGYRAITASSASSASASAVVRVEDSPPAKRVADWKRELEAEEKLGQFQKRQRVEADKEEPAAEAEEEAEMPTAEGDDAEGEDAEEEEGEEE